MATNPCRSLSSGLRNRRREQGLTVSLIVRFSLLFLPIGRKRAYALVHRPSILPSIPSASAGRWPRKEGSINVLQRAEQQKSPWPHHCPLGRLEGSLPSPESCDTSPLPFSSMPGEYGETDASIFRHISHLQIRVFGSSHSWAEGDMLATDSSSSGRRRMLYRRILRVAGSSVVVEEGMYELRRGAAMVPHRLGIPPNVATKGW